MYIIVLRTTKGGETMIGTLLRRISDWMVGEYQPKKEKTTEKKEEECVVVEGESMKCVINDMDNIDEWFDDSFWTLYYAGLIPGSPFEDTHD